MKEEWSTFNCDPKMHLKMEVVNELMRLRNIKNYRKLANMIDVCRSAISRVTSGEHLPSTTTIARLCFVLGCQPGDLLYVDYNLKREES